MITVLLGVLVVMGVVEAVAVAVRDFFTSVSVFNVLEVVEIEVLAKRFVEEAIRSVKVEDEVMIDVEALIAGGGGIRTYFLRSLIIVCSH